MILRHTPIGILAAVFVLSTFVSTYAQESPSQLQRENERLRDENTKLQRELEEALARVAALEAEVRRLEQQLAAAEEATPAAPPPPLPEDPFAAPDAMFAHVRERYEEAFRDYPNEAEQDRNRYQRDVQRWSQQINRDLVADVEWLIRLDALTQRDGRTYLMRYWVIDPTTKKEIGARYSTSLTEREAKLFTRWGEGDMLLIGARFGAELDFDSKRAEPSMFDYPRFVGPYATFGYELVFRKVIEFVPPADAESDAST
jgi:hypothetical protein